MPIKTPSLLYYATFKPQSFSIKFPKYLRELKITHHKKPLIPNADIRKLRLCKLVRLLQTSFPNDVLKKPLYELLCRLHQKTIQYLNTNGVHYYHIIRNPRRYDLQLGNFKSWKTLFQKKSVRFLKAYCNPYDPMLTEKQVACVKYHLQHSSKELLLIRDIEFAGHILTHDQEDLVDQLSQAIQRNRTNMSIELKVWDHNSEDLIWLDTPVIRQHTSLVYFVNRCHNANCIAEPLESLPSFHKLQKLEFWVRLHQKNDFSVLKKLELCKELKDLRLRIDFDGELEKVSKKFLTNIRFPSSLTYLNFSVSGLRLYWINQGLPRIKDLEEDKITAGFLEQFEKLENLEVFSFALHDLRINFSSIFINIIRRLVNLKELSVIMGLREFEFKEAPNYLILDFSFWCRKLKHIFSQLRSISMELPCLYLGELETDSNLLKKVETISLGYRILSKDKTAPNVNLLLEMFNPHGIIGLYIGDSATQGEEDFKKRFETLAKMSSLQNLTIAMTINTISEQLFENFCWCLVRMHQLRRFSCRLEKAYIQVPQWRPKLKKTFAAMKNLNWATLACNNGKIEFE